MEKGLVPVDVTENRNEISMVNNDFDSMINYSLVSSKDMDMGLVVFKANIPVTMTGLLAKKMIENGKGFIKLYNPREIEKEKEKEELEELKEAVAELRKESKKDSKKDSKKSD